MILRYFYTDSNLIRIIVQSAWVARGFTLSSCDEVVITYNFVGEFPSHTLTFSSLVISSSFLYDVSPVIFFSPLFWLHNKLIWNTILVKSSTKSFADD